ncbi:hypothetical protein [Xanthomonas floridensis]|uniref:Uncharacterized protein n=1 Tax=Xanthomonas floridensis TaxID=1843580 RepID=A0A1A9M7K7_9XANT|nr:hypothetical protein [Xanthomonas floridensis]MEA5123063.1 hypothetical protein [Xanthomonas floridensis]MEA5130521.1 hypothetical protein [Xanthomonas floridensis]OAG66102.1 hypothetical protein A7D17_06535 [Xanthomonas floridensis]
MTDPLRPPLSRLWLPEPSGGMSLQLSASLDGGEHTLLTLSADAQDEAVWVTLQAGAVPVQIPLATLRQLLEVAVEEVHSAEWFARQDSD